MKLELADVFRGPQPLGDAVKIFRLLWDLEAENKTLNQKEIAKKLLISERKVSTILSQLNKHGYITREIGEHGEKIPRIKERPYLKTRDFKVLKAAFIRL